MPRAPKDALVGAESVSDPYPAYAKLREQGPVHRVLLRDGLHCWVVTGYDEVRAALGDPRLTRDPRSALAGWETADRGRPLEDGANLGVHLLTREPPEHTRLRRLVSTAFGSRRAAELRPRVKEVADRLVDAFVRQGEADLIADFAYPLAITMMTEILGIADEDRAIFRQWTSNAVRPAPFAVPDPSRYLRDLLSSKRRTPGADLTTSLIEAAADDRLSEAELESMIFLLLMAGHEGSVALIGNAVLALLQDDAQKALLLARPDLVISAVEEILRYDGPMELAAWRFATEPLEIGGTLIETGAPVVLALAAAHRDPAQFTEPDRLDITRTANAHLGFGYGVHYCLGAPLARIEGTVALETLFRRLPDLEIAAPPENLRRQASQVVRGLYELPVRFTPSGPNAAAY